MPCQVRPFAPTDSSEEPKKSLVSRICGWILARRAGQVGDKRRFGWRRQFESRMTFSWPVQVWCSIPQRCLPISPLAWNQQDQGRSCVSEIPRESTGGLSSVPADFEVLRRESALGQVLDLLRWEPNARNESQQVRLIAAFRPTFA